MLSTEPTFDPCFIPRLAGSNSKALATFAWVTDTPFGVPVLPAQRVNNVFAIHDGTYQRCIWRSNHRLDNISQVVD